MDSGVDNNKMNLQDRGSNLICSSFSKSTKKLILLRGELTFTNL